MRETLIGCLLHTPNWGPGPQPVRETSMCPHWESNQWHCCSQAGTQSTEPHQSGLHRLVLKLLKILALAACLWIEGLSVWFPVRAHPWVVGEVPGWGRSRQPIDVSLPPFPSFYKWINKIFLKILKILFSSEHKPFWYIFKLHYTYYNMHTSFNLYGRPWCDWKLNPILLSSHSLHTFVSWTCFLKIQCWGSSGKQPEVTSKNGHCSSDPESPTKSCKSRGSNLHFHFKNTHETSQAIKGMHFRKATKYLKDVTLQKQCVTFGFKSLQWWSW